MDHPDPLSVSVVIPTYNRSARVCSAIESALAQTRPAAEVIVVDDGSTDGTADLLAARFGGRIRCITQPNQGVAAARNTGIREARSALVAFLDSDDIWLPEKLERQVPAMADETVVLSATNWAWSDAPARGKHGEIGLATDKPVLIEDEPLRRLCAPRGHGINIQTCICRRAVLQRLGGFDTGLRISEDMELIFRLADEGRFAILSDILLLRGASGSGDNLTKPASDAWRAENLDNIIGILETRRRLPRTRSPECRHALARRLTQLRSYRAQLFARTGALAEARRVSRQGLVPPVLSKEALVCAAGAVMPRLLRRGR